MAELLIWLGAVSVAALSLLGLVDSFCYLWETRKRPDESEAVIAYAEGLAISQAIVYGHCDKCGFLPQCSTQGEAFQFPVFAWCMRRKAEILANMQEEET